MRTLNQSQTSNKSLVRDAAIQITLNSQPITRDTLDGVSYYTTTRRGVEYCAYKTGAGNWFVSTHRAALGQRHIGGGRYYNDLCDLSANCKAFAALPALINFL